MKSFFIYFSIVMLVAKPMLGKPRKRFEEDIQHYHEKEGKDVDMEASPAAHSGGQFDYDDSPNGWQHQAADLETDDAMLANYEEALPSDLHKNDGIGHFDDREEPLEIEQQSRKASHKKKKHNKELMDYDFALD